MRTLILALIAAGCAVDGGVHADNPAAAARDDGSKDPKSGDDGADGVGDDGVAEPTIEGHCLGDPCEALWLTVVPPTDEVVWSINGEETAKGAGVVVPLPYKPITVHAETPMGGLDAAASAATVEDPVAGPSPYVVIQWVRGCDEFRVVAVGGCFTGANGVRFEAPALHNPYAPLGQPQTGSVTFSFTPPTAALGGIGFAYAAWWPTASGQARAVQNPPPGVAVPLQTSTVGVEFRHAVARGTVAAMRAVHDAGGSTHQLQMFTAVCTEDGVGSLAPHGGQ